MSLLKAALRRIAADLKDAGVSFAVVGGLAVSARTEPRFTRDADLAVAIASVTRSRLPASRSVMQAIDQPN